MPDADKKAEKLCTLCKGTINPETGICTVCGVKDEEGQPEQGIKNEDDALTRWLKGDTESISKWIESEEQKKPEDAPTESVPTPEQAQTQTQPGQQSQVTAPPKEEINTLKKWFTGADDGSIEQWLDAGEQDVNVPMEIFAPMPVTEARPPAQPGITSIAAVTGPSEENEKLKAELEVMKKQLDEYLSRYKKEDFDPVKLTEENIQLNKGIQAEISRREKMEREYGDLKRGTIAVIKYLRTHQARAGPSIGTGAVVVEGDAAKSIAKKDEEIESLKRQLESGMAGMPEDVQELKKKELAIADREKQVQQKEEELKIRQQMLLEHERAGVAAQGGQAADVIKRMQGELADKDREYAAIQKSLQLRDEEIRDLRNEIKMKDDEINKIKQPLKFKEEELMRREEDMRYREEKMAKEARKIQEASKKIGTMTQQEMEKRLEELQHEISMKEAEVKAKEKYISMKQRELEAKAKGLIEQEVDMTKAERDAELQEMKVKTGTARLDDLLYGGIPLSSNILVYGPAFIWKETLLNTFAAEGLKKGVPVIWVLTNKTIKTIREEMQFLLPNYADYEKVGLVRYVDIYSRTIGETSMDPGVIYIDQPTDTGAINDAVDSFAKELQKKRHEYYRLVFQSISTIMVRLVDPGTTFKFLSPFCGKRKKDRGVCLYTLEMGMHTDSDIKMISSMMEGEFDFKAEHDKTYLQVKGISEAQSRDWIEYSGSKRGLNIKSFSLKLIK